MVNSALDINGDFFGGPGTTAGIAITVDGSNLYFAICSAMGFAGACFIGLAMRKQRSDRLFHYITAAVVFVACIAYFTMGSNLGWVPIKAEFIRPNRPVVRGTYREIFYARYIDWVITTPLLLLDLLLTAGMPWPSILWTILIDEIMITTGLMGALVTSRYKWGYYSFGCAALFYILYMLIFEARKHAKAYGRDVSRAFLMTGSLTALLWTLYPVAWGLCEGGNVISPDSEAIFYGTLDFLAKPCFGALLLWAHKDINPARLGLAINDYSGDAAIDEKRRPGEGPGANVHPNGNANGVNGTNGTQVPHTNETV